jgi:hypothetical protein|tara:strand:+ start:797 stop:1993 length:1197 start_codon:yes stop_codon:yes gene_type:complete
MLNVLIVLTTILAGGLLLYPKLANCRVWRAAITPLASIIGSGFLVLGPILNASFGQYAPLIMAVLCAVAYAFGAAIRFNIARLARAATTRSKSEEWLDVIASWALAFAYIISVAYYLNLLGAFTVSLTTFDDPFYAKLITSAVFTVILVVGWTRGFSALERLEQVSVGVKLSIIAGLLFGLGWFFVEKAALGGLITNPPTVGGWQAFALTAGLLVTVQGFETSRYLDEEYSAHIRIRSMQLAQWTATVIYMIYILLLSYVFEPSELVLEETAIIDMMSVIAPILPWLLIAAAISAQFSAAVADTGGSGGLLSELTGKRMSPRNGYTILCVAGMCLTWTMGVFEIISYASRAFAFYYALQACIAAKGAFLTDKMHLTGVAFAILGLVGFAIAVFGSAIE